MPQQDRAAVPDEQLVEARRNARFTFAQRRIQKIVDGAPPLTDEQRARLICQIVDAAPPLSAETRARLRPVLAGGIPAAGAAAEAMNARATA
jgi:hypothetical protein